MNQAVPPLAQGDLDRDAPTRLDSTLLAAAWGDPTARLLCLNGAQIPVTEDSRLALLPTAGDLMLETSAGDVHHVYLGRLAGAPMFARAAKADEPAGGPLLADANPDQPAATAAATAAAAQWQPTFVAAIKLPEAERELVAVASALLRWHESAIFSGVDGSRTHPVQAGWARVDATGREFFPRTDPAVIVLIEHDDKVLLGSNALWEEGRFSLLAGFVEAGESLEQTVRREVFEESGVVLGNVQYVTSQPWPFPRSLMLGFRAQLAPGQDPAALQADPAEISELRWFSRDELRNPAPGIVLPGSMSIARWLLEQWCEEQPAA